MMTSKEFENLVEQHFGKINLGSYVSVSLYNRLKPILERELAIQLSPDWHGSKTFIDLWRIVNSKIENIDNSGKTTKNTKMKKSTSKKENTSVVIKKESMSLPISASIAKKLSAINQRIESDKEELDGYLDDIQNAEPTIDIGNLLGFLPIPKKSDIEDSMSEVYSSLCDYIVTCGNAIQATNGNLSNILELIHLLTAAEVDLYNLIDNQAIQGDELRLLIKEWCKEHGIHDDEVDKLLEKSFQRAFTLRDRINDLRRDFYEKFDEFEGQLKPLIDNVTNYKEDIRQSLDKALKDLTTATNDEIERIDTLKAEFDSQWSGLNKQIDAYFVKMSNKEEELKKQSLDLSDRYASVSEKLELDYKDAKMKLGVALEELKQQRINDSQALEEEQHIKLSNLEKKLQAAFENLNNELETFRSEIEFGFSKKEESIDQTLKTAEEAQNSFVNSVITKIDDKLRGVEDMQNKLSQQDTVIEKLGKQIKVIKIVAFIAVGISIASTVVAVVL